MPTRLPAPPTIAPGWRASYRVVSDDPRVRGFVFGAYDTFERARDHWRSIRRGDKLPCSIEIVQRPA